jgi:hypothetical protein
MELAPFRWSRRTFGGCRGFTGPSPSTPLDVYGYVEARRIAGQPDRATDQVKLPVRQTSISRPRRRTRTL